MLQAEESVGLEFGVGVFVAIKVLPFPELLCLRTLDECCGWWKAGCKVSPRCFALLLWAA
jgi:hypothetical protein